MNRRDIIILATVVNAVLLLVLFTTAQRPNKSYDLPVASLPVKMVDINTHQPAAHKSSEPANKVDSKKIANKSEPHCVKESTEPVIQKTVNKTEANRTLSVVDQSKHDKQVVAVTKDKEPAIVPVVPQKIAADSSSIQPETSKTQQVSQEVNQSGGQYTTVVVKKGDFLERIAKANHTTVAVLMQINDLSSTQLKIGQVIKVPVSDKVDTNPQVKASNPNDYYTVKEGDSPWGIALRNGIRLNELLQMNDLDEQKARKLRPGDRLRIR